MPLKFNEFSEPIGKEDAAPWDVMAGRVREKVVRWQRPGRPCPLPMKKPPKDTLEQMLTKRRALIKFMAEKRSI